MLDNSTRINHMDLGKFIFKMMISQRGYLFMEDVKAKEDLLRQIVVIMREILKIMLQMDMASIQEEKVLNMKAMEK